MPQPWQPINGVSVPMFQDKIQEAMNRLPDGIAGILMGFDGIAVESFTAIPGQADIQNVGMEFSHVLTQVRRAAEMAHLGTLQQVTIASEHLTILIQVLSREYFVAFALLPTGNCGKARYLLRLLAPEIQREL